MAYRKRTMVCPQCGCSFDGYPSGYSEEPCCSSRCGALRRWQRVSPEDRFWSRVQKTDGCWIWTGAASGGDSGGGYGNCHWNGKTMLAHRVSYLLEHGTLPDLLILHSCDTPLCVRPSHLFVGTQTDNMQDMIWKGRQRGGFHAKHPDRIVRAIHALAGLMSQSEIGRRMGVSQVMVSMVLRGKTRRSVV